MEESEKKGSSRKKRPAPDGDEELRARVKCAICMDYPIPKKARICSECGNLLCMECIDNIKEKTKKKDCPFCARNATFGRCVLATDVLERCIFPCSMAGRGCPGVMTSEERARHVKQCTYRPYYCPALCRRCEQLELNTESDVRKHLVDVHHDAWEHGDLQSYDLSAGVRKILCQGIENPTAMTEIGRAHV